jgi:predicted secreted acid phosphatase
MNRFQNLVSIFDKVHRSDKDVVVFDIDLTLLDANMKPIKDLYNFYQYVRSSGASIAIITAREEFPLNRAWTEEQLNELGYRDYTYLYLRDHNYRDIKIYKEKARFDLFHRGMNVIMSLGDMHWDFGKYGGIGILVR